MAHSIRFLNKLTDNKRLTAALLQTSHQTLIKLLTPKSLTPEQNIRYTPQVIMAAERILALPLKQTPHLSSSDRALARQSLVAIEDEYLDDFRQHCNKVLHTKIRPDRTIALDEDLTPYLPYITEAPHSTNKALTTITLTILTQSFKAVRRSFPNKAPTSRSWTVAVTRAIEKCQFDISQPALQFFFDNPAPPYSQALLSTTGHKQQIIRELKLKLKGDHYQ